MIPETIYKYKSISFKQVDFTKAKEIIDSNDKKNYDNSNIGYYSRTSFILCYS